MALANLGDLKASIADWLNRDDLSSVIPDFILMAQNRINHDVQSFSDGYVYSETLAFSSQANPLSSIAVDQVETLVVDDEVIPYVTYETYISERKNPTRSNGVWTIIDDSVHYSKFNDTPPASGNDVDIKAMGHRLLAIDFNDDTFSLGLLGENPEIVLYAALVEASIYLRDLEGTQIYQPRYDELIGKLKSNYRRQRVAGGMAVSSVGGDY